MKLTWHTNNKSISGIESSERTSRSGIRPTNVNMKRIRIDSTSNRFLAMLCPILTVATEKSRRLFQSNGPDQVITDKRCVLHIPIWVSCLYHIHLLTS